MRSGSWSLRKLAYVLLVISIGAPTLPAGASFTGSAAKLPMVTGIACQAGSDSDEVRLLIRVEQNVSYRSELLEKPDRLYLDLKGTRLGSMHATIDLGPCATRVSRVRIAEHEPGTTRVVFDLTHTLAYVASESQDPPGVTLSLRTAVREGKKSPAPDKGQAYVRKKAIPVSAVPPPHSSELATANVLDAANPAGADDRPDPPPPIEDLFATIQRADNGDANEQAALGHAHESGQLGGFHYAQAIRWYERAAEHGNVYAAVRLGEMYANGVGTERNVEQAVHYYGIAASHSAFARARLRELSQSASPPVEPVTRGTTGPPPSRAPAALSPAESSPSRSNPPRPVTTEVVAGRAPHIRGNENRPVLPVVPTPAHVEPLPLDPSEKLRTLEHPSYQSTLAALPTVVRPPLPPPAVTPALKFDPARAPRDPVAAAKWYLDAAQQGSSEAQYRVGKIYFEGKSIPKDFVKAATWLHRAAEQGHASAQSDFGLLCLNGWGVPKNADEALKWFRKSAETGDAVGQNNLGAAYITGRGVPLNYAEGARWLQKAAEQGLTEAEYALGTLYANGRGVPKNAAIAVQWFVRAATKGYPRAQLLLGEMYLSGQGIPRDYAQARQWLERAAMQGSPEAELTLARIFRDGLGTPRAGADALSWFKKAAVDGSAEAQYALGEMYMEGKLVAANPILAYAWFAVAASSGQQSGLKAINTIAPKMTIEQIAAAQKQAYVLAAQLNASRNPARTETLFNAETSRR